VRAFLALELSPEIKTALSDLLRKLKRLAPPSIGWVSEEGMHLTLKFLGEIDDGLAARVARSLRDVAAGTEGFPLTVHGTGRFPEGPRPPRVLWAGVAESPGLMDFQARLESALAALGLPPEERPFHPHLTLGRVRSSGGLRTVVDELERRREVVFGTMDVRGASLFRSVLKPGGAEHTVLDRGDFR
jgi:2'-5' RNA ligase